MHRTRILRRGTHWRGRISTRVIPLGIWASFAVTAEHVYDGYLEDRAARRIRSCQIGNVAFDDPEDRLIARGKHLGIDIATFRVTPAEIAARGNRIVEGTDGAWPAPSNDCEAVFFAGFPGGERIPKPTWPDRYLRN